jgi:pyruvate formate lyase activating enzyme
VTTLIIPGVNDSPEELLDIADFISSELGPDTPWHISRFFPNHRMQTTPATPVETMSLAGKIGHEAGLKYVYMGNIHEESSNTQCPKCGLILILRKGYYTDHNGIKDGECKNCGEEIAGVWE